MHVFWRKGYEGTSLSELTRAMHINPPSLYAAFGDKEALFAKVIDRYLAGPGSYFPKALEARTARAVVERLLAGVTKLQTAPGHPGGCLIVRGALASGDRAARPREKAGACLVAVESAIRQRLE